jgi:hypothetical protein
LQGTNDHNQKSIVSNQKFFGRLRKASAHTCYMASESGQLLHRLHRAGFSGGFNCDRGCHISQTFGTISQRSDILLNAISEIGDHAAEVVGLGKLGHFELVIPLDRQLSRNVNQ